MPVYHQVEVPKKRLRRCSGPSGHFPHQPALLATSRSGRAGLEQAPREREGGGAPSREQAAAGERQGRRVPGWKLPACCCLLASHFMSPESCMVCHLPIASRILGARLFQDTALGSTYLPANLPSAQLTSFGFQKHVWHFAFTRYLLLSFLICIHTHFTADY